MKWSQFKKAVEEKLSAEGVTDPDITYIDIGMSGPEFLIINLETNKFEAEEHTSMRILA